MLGEAFALFEIGRQIGSAVAKPYRKLLVEEKVQKAANKAGVKKIRKKLNKVDPVDVNRVPVFNISCLKLDFDTKTDMLGIITGRSTLYLTPDEISYLDKIESSGDWDSASGTIAWILKTQDARAQAYI